MTTPIGGFTRQHGIVPRVAGNEITTRTHGQLARLDIRDPTMTGRAQSAYDEAMRHLRSIIDDIMRDGRLSREDRAAAVRAWRARQLEEARGASRRIRRDETAAAKERRRQKRELARPDPR